MSFVGLLIHEADIKRFTPDGGADAYGHPTGAWGNVYADEPCRFVSTKGREIRRSNVAVLAPKKI